MPFPVIMGIGVPTKNVKENNMATYFYTSGFLSINPWTHYGGTDEALARGLQDHSS